MKAETECSLSWKEVRNARSAHPLIANGVMIRWTEMRILKKEIPEEEQCQIMRYFAEELCESITNRLACETIVENILIWIAHATNDSLVRAFFLSLFEKQQHHQAAKMMVEIALTSEISENRHDEELYSMAVALVCELGICIRAFEMKNPGSFNKAKDLIDTITTYLSSVSNSNSTSIRLSLLHYFGWISYGHQNKTAFNRIMNRFGHTVLNHLFASLFNKKSEAISLQYLLENLPYILEASPHCQKILHETLKYYMLKRSERFMLFIKTFSKNLLSDPNGSCLAKKTLLQHIAALFKVTSEVNHKVLASNLLIVMRSFYTEPDSNDLLERLYNAREIRADFRKMLSHMLENQLSDTPITPALCFRSLKRGRKPSFSRAEHIGTMGQIKFLGSSRLPRAS